MGKSGPSYVILCTGTTVKLPGTQLKDVCAYIRHALYCTTTRPACLRLSNFTFYLSHVGTRYKLERKRKVDMYCMAVNIGI